MCFLLVTSVVIADSLVGEWFFIAEGSLYQIVLSSNDSSRLSSAFFPADDFEVDPFALRLTPSAYRDFAILEKLNFIDDAFISLHFVDGHNIKGIYSLNNAPVVTYLKSNTIWKLTVFDANKEEYVFYLRHKSDSDAIQMTYRLHPYYVFGTLENAEGKTISLDSYE